MLGRFESQQHCLQRHGDHVTCTRLGACLPRHLVDVAALSRSLEALWSLLAEGYSIWDFVALWRAVC